MTESGSWDDFLAAFKKRRPAWFGGIAGNASRMPTIESRVSEVNKGPENAKAQAVVTQATFQKAPENVVDRKLAASGEEWDGREDFGEEGTNG